MSADVTITWHGEHVMALVEAAVAQGMEVAGKALSASTKRNISTSYPPASRPGQPPHRRSGGLHGAVTHRVSRQGRNVTMSVGVPDGSPVARQAEALQKGTSRMAARPFVPEEGRSTVTVIGYVEASVKAALR